MWGFSIARSVLSNSLPNPLPYRFKCKFTVVRRSSKILGCRISVVVVVVVVVLIITVVVVVVIVIVVAAAVFVTAFSVYVCVRSYSGWLSFSSLPGR